MSENESFFILYKIIKKYAKDGVKMSLYTVNEKSYFIRQTKITKQRWNAVEIRDSILATVKSGLSLVRYPKYQSASGMARTYDIRIMPDGKDHPVFLLQPFGTAPGRAFRG